MSDFSKDVFTDNGIHKEKCITIYDGIDIERFRSSNNSNNGIITSGTGNHLIGGCVMADTGSSGLNLSNECVISGCIMLRNAVGVDIASVSNCSITGSNISNNTGHDRLLIGTSPQLVITLHSQNIQCFTPIPK